MADSPLTFASSALCNVGFAEYFGLPPGSLTGQNNWVASGTFSPFTIVSGVATAPIGIAHRNQNLVGVAAIDFTLPWRIDHTCNIQTVGDNINSAGFFIGDKSNLATSFAVEYNIGTGQLAAHNCVLNYHVPGGAATLTGAVSVNFALGSTLSAAYDGVNVTISVNGAIVVVVAMDGSLVAPHQIGINAKATGTDLITTTGISMGNT